jgi:predicted ester cyclase
MNNLFRAFPDLYFAIDDVITQEDKVVLRLIESGTMTGGLMNFRPTGRKFTLEAAQICRLARGKLIEIRDFRDTGSLLRQLKVATTLAPVMA